MKDMGLEPRWQRSGRRRREKAKLNPDAEENTALKISPTSAAAAFTFLLPHAEEEHDSTEDVDQADDARSDHVSRFLLGKTPPKNK